MSLAQLPNSKPTRIKHGFQTLDQDGFEEQVYIKDDSNTENGIGDAVLIDPLQSSKSVEKLSSLQRSVQQLPGKKH